MSDERAAATVLVVRGAPTDLQVLMLRRSAGSPAFPGAWVFPGGVVSAEDRTAADPLRAAAVREVREECALVLSPADLVEVSEWLPPANALHRFRTRFYLVEDPGGQVQVDGFEVEDAAWVRPAEALEHHAAGRWDFLPPTWVTLAGLSTGAIIQGRFHSHVVSSAPTVLAWSGDDAHPDEPGGAGARHRITLTERPWQYERTAVAGRGERRRR